MSRKQNPYSEEALQKQVAQYLRQEPRLKGALWTAIESAGRGPRDGARQKAKGVNPGWPDLMFFDPEAKPIAIELKRPAVKVIGQARGSQSADQKAYSKALIAAGGHYYLAYSLDDVQAIIKTHF